LSGYAVGSSGAFTLGSSAASIATLAVNALECYGSNGAGTYIQNGGTPHPLQHLPHRRVLPRLQRRRHRTATLNAGTLTMPVNQLYVGYSGNGSFTQTGGTNNPYYLTMGYLPGSMGIYNLTGGTVNANSVT